MFERAFKNVSKFYDCSNRFRPKERDEEDTKLITELTNQFPIFVHLPPFVRQGLARLVRYERRNPNEVGMKK